MSEQYITGHRAIDELIAGNLKLASLTGERNKPRQAYVNAQINQLRHTLLQRVAAETESAGHKQANKISARMAFETFRSFQSRAASDSLVVATRPAPKAHPRKSHVDREFAMAYTQKNRYGSYPDSDECRFLKKLYSEITGSDLNLQTNVPHYKIKEILYAELARVAKWSDVFSTLPKLGWTNWLTTYVPTLLELPLRYVSGRTDWLLLATKESLQEAWRDNRMHWFFKGITLFWGSVFFLLVGACWIVEQLPRICADFIAQVRYALNGLFNLSPIAFFRNAFPATATFLAMSAVVILLCVPIFGQMAAGGAAVVIGLLKLLGLILATTTVAKIVTNAFQYCHWKKNPVRPDWVTWTPESHMGPTKATTSSQNHHNHGNQQPNNPSDRHHDLMRDELSAHLTQDVKEEPPVSNTLTLQPVPLDSLPSDAIIYVQPDKIEPGNKLTLHCPTSSPRAFFKDYGHIEPSKLPPQAKPRVYKASSDINDMSDITKEKAIRTKAKPSAKPLFVVFAEDLDPAQTINSSFGTVHNYPVSELTTGPIELRPTFRFRELSNIPSSNAAAAVSKFPPAATLSSGRTPSSQAASPAPQGIPFSSPCNLHLHAPAAQRPASDNRAAAPSPTPPPPTPPPANSVLQ